MKKSEDVFIFSNKESFHLRPSKIKFIICWSLLKNKVISYRFFHLKINLSPANLVKTVEFSRAADQLAERLEGPFLMGNQITIPDLLAVHCINWSIGAGFPRLNDTVAYWAKSLRERNAFKVAQGKETA